MANTSYVGLFKSAAAAITDLSGIPTWLASGLQSSEAPWIVTSGGTPYTSAGIVNYISATPPDPVNLVAGLLWLDIST